MNTTLHQHSTLSISVAAAVGLSVSAVAAARAGDAPTPPPIYSWSPADTPQGERAPKTVSFRGGHALRCSHEKQTRVDLGQGEDDRLRIRGALTLAAVVQLADVPHTKTPFISKWHCRTDGRSYELGVQPDRRVFFAISESGVYDEKARELFTDRKLRVGVPYHVVGVFEPGKRMNVRINGVDSGTLRSRVPKTVFDSETPVLLGNRPGSEPGSAFDGILAGAWVYSSALSKETVMEQSKEMGLTAPPESEYDDANELPTCRTITRGPKHHWFGYYDKLQFDPTCRYVLGMEADFEGRSPTADDVIKIGMVDLQDGDKWIELGESRSWCWQQGCMLQWRPGSQTEMLWNDRQGDRFVCHILDIVTRRKRTIPHPVYTLSPDGQTACSPDFRRVQDMRPGYGYPGLPDPNADVQAPADSGIWRVDLDTGESTLIVTLADVARIPHEHGDLSPMKHYFNHLLISPDGTRLEFLHRWRGPGVKSFGTRMLTCALDGTDLYVLDPHGHTSHFIWRDPAHICAWSWHPDLGNGFVLYKDKTREVELVGKGVMTQNGHNTYLPDTDWILNDTYPDNRRRQHPYLYHVPTGKRLWLGHFESPPGYSGEWRCDTHPRFSPDGKSVVIDSAHGGEGRQMHLIDISGIVASPPPK